MGTEMIIDFSPKGGPKDLLAKWDGPRNGIAFPDGNLWAKKEKSAPPVHEKSPFEGDFHDPNHPEGYRKITVKEGVCTVVGCDGPGKKEWTFVQNVIGGQMGTEMVIDFSPKGGPKDLLAKWDGARNGIAFPDGNLWAKK